jgi:CRP/FNR family cyclic AMP-dependent transcriptional regulator
MDNKLTEAFRRIPLFAGLHQEALQALSKLSHYQSFAAGEMMIGHQDQSFDVLFLVSGHARVNIYSSAGKRVSFREIREGAIFGELSALDGCPRSASVEAVTSCSAVVMPRQAFLKTVREQPVFMLSVMVHLTTLVRSLTERVFEFSTLAVRNRVHAELLRIAGDREGRNEARISPPPTHEEIASRISTHREAVTRELARLEEMGLISKEGRVLRINDLAALHRLVEQGTVD